MFPEMIWYQLLRKTVQTIFGQKFGSFRFLNHASWTCSQAVYCAQHPPLKW